MLSQIKDVTFYIIFSIYNKLFDHLKASIRQLQWKKVAWKNLMLSALHAVKEKLSVYYGEIDKFFNNKDWGPELRDKYRKSFKTYAALIALWTFWKEHEYKFPALVKMARDILLIPATGAGVERLFNSA
ncbi:hypothetical protein GB937_010172 [Aspergillus fischeri]|nr:hypothetical protein GB937_010172 [Aspergillus fischeri]